MSTTKTPPHTRRSGIAIFGTGGHAKEIAYLLHDLQRGKEIAGFFEPDDQYTSRTIMGHKVLPQSQYDPSKQSVVVAIGSPTLRKQVVNGLPKKSIHETLIHPRAEVSQWVSLGDGNVITAGCIVTCDITIGQYVHLNRNVTVGHDCIIGDYCFLAPGVVLSGNCTLGKLIDMGTQSATKQGVTICDNVIVGMGAMVVKDITAAGTYIGIPAKRLPQ